MGVFLKLSRHLRMIIANGIHAKNPRWNENFAKRPRYEKHYALDFDEFSIYFPNQRCHHSFLIISTISRKHEARVQGQLDAPSAHSSFSHRLLIARISHPYITSPTSPTEEPPTNVSCSATTPRLPSSMDRRNKMHTDVRSSLWKFMISMRGR